MGNCCQKQSRSGAPEVATDGVDSNTSNKTDEADSGEEKVAPKTSKLRKSDPLKMSSTRQLSHLVAALDAVEAFKDLNSRELNALTAQKASKTLQAFEAKKLAETSKGDREEEKGATTPTETKSARTFNIAL